MINTSLVIAVYNGERTLDEAFASVASQTHPIAQVVVVNDGSTDKTSLIIERWKETLPLLVINNVSNLGLANSLNIGVRYATGELVFRLDADDVWCPNHVEVIVELSLSCPQAVLLSSRAYILNNKGKLAGITSAVMDRNIRAKLFWDNPVVHSAVAFRRRAYNEVGGYIHQSFAVDYDLWIRLLKSGRYAGTTEVTTYYHVLSSSLSRIKKTDSLRVRLSLGLSAVKLFGVKHPFVAVFILPVILIRILKNRVYCL